VNEISDEDIGFFLHGLEKKLDSGEFPKLRELEKMFKPRLSSQKIIAVLGYLQRSGMIEVDLDGNIIWIKRGPSGSFQSSTLFDAAIMSEDFRRMLQNHSDTQYHTD
jgi:hypothetical protein